jgi:predicted RND superfamily exporter protein
MSILVCIIGSLVMGGIKLGAVEALSLSILVGISVDYVLHVAHSYNISPSITRFGKTMDTLVERGSSIITAAFTTIMSVSVLFLTTIVLFSIFARIFVVTITFSIIFSLFFFMTVLVSNVMRCERN